MQTPDIIFLSYSESNADSNWNLLVDRFPGAKRVHGVRGIAEAHRAAAELSSSPFFFLVDGDNQIVPQFDFNLKGLVPEQETLYVWRCRNPVNGLVYGYGAIKLYNKSLVEKRSLKNYVDHATRVTHKYQIVNEIASETHFFATPEEAWRGAFRECAKLSSQCIDRQKSDETQRRLQTWCEVFRNVPNADWVKKGALEGAEFGKVGELEKINDFMWLRERFNGRSSETV